MLSLLFMMVTVVLMLQTTLQLTFTVTLQETNALKRIHYWL